MSTLTLYDLLQHLSPETLRLVICDLEDVDSGGRGTIRELIETCEQQLESLEASEARR